jgi:hypothetical protein
VLADAGAPVAAAGPALPPRGAVEAEVVEGSPIAIGIRICSTTASSDSTAKKGGSALITVVPLRLEDGRANP